VLLVGMGFIYIYSFFFVTVYSEDDIREHFDTPIMAQVTKLKKRSINPMEPFLHLYTNLNNKHLLKGGKTIAVCSGHAKEGKSIVTAQLGKLLASFDINVLLIDMNMEKPTLHEYFKMENYAGMDDILEHDAHAHSLIRTNGMQNLSLITAGSKSATTSTQVFSPRTGSFLEKMRAEYDVILIDTAAVTRRLDAAAIMQLCDANLYLFRKGHSRKRRLSKAKSFIQKYQIPNVYLVYNRG
ncbi:MAG: CpsD/CapB family tyrosine-protein kinase, partial [Bacteroidota bacterium]